MTHHARHIHKAVAALALLLTQAPAAKAQTAGDTALDSLRQQAETLRAALRQQLDSADTYSAVAAELGRTSFSKAKSALEKDRDRLTLRRDTFLARRDSLQAALDAKTRRLAQLQGEADGLKVYADMRKSQELQDCRDYLKQSLTALDTSRLARMKASAADYSGIDGYTAYTASLSLTDKAKRLYDDGTTAINRPYDPGAITALRGRMREMAAHDPSRKSKDTKLTKEQFGQLDTLDISLSRYAGGVRLLQGIVQQVNSDTTVTAFRNGKTGDPQEAKTAAYKYIDPNINSDEEKAMQRYLDFIPYLKRLFKAYEQQFSRDVKTPGKAEEEIKSYKVK